MAKKLNPQYVAQCKAFLAEKALGPNVITLPKGVLLEYIKHGEGSVCPTSRNVVTVNYEGRLVDGTVFDSSLDSNCPVPLRLKEVIDGWQIALSTMHAGDKAVVYIPSDMGYGNRTEGNIPGGSALIFEIELLAIH